MQLKNLQLDEVYPINENSPQDSLIQQFNKKIYWNENFYKPLASFDGSNQQDDTNFEKKVYNFVSNKKQK